MKNTQISSKTGVFILTVALLFLTLTGTKAQNYTIGVFADPVISWFSSNNDQTQNEGSRPGFNFGATFNWYFTESFSLSTGLNMLNFGGRLENTETITMVFNNLTSEVMAGDPVVYSVRYISLPIGLKLESDQIGYMRIFTDIGFDLKYAISGKADIPSNDIEGESAMNELKSGNIGWHVIAGGSYALGEKTEFIFGLGFERLMLDITEDIEPQPRDVVKGNLIKFRLGLIF
jgi:hypothetical protein